MKDDDYRKVIEEAVAYILGGCNSVAVLGLSEVATRLLADLSSRGLSGAVRGIYADSTAHMLTRHDLKVRPFQELAEAEHDLLVVTEDGSKEDLLLRAKQLVRNQPKVVLGGYGHFAFKSQQFEEIRSQLLVPSLANGYPNSLVHLYQCLVNAARLDLEGVVAEFGMFRGGTTAFLAKTVQAVGKSWPVIGFDTFDGFPAPRSFLDMYRHPDCVFTDINAVKAYADTQRVEVVVGDVVQTCCRLVDEKIVLAFVDTDNYSSAAAILDVITDRVVVGGAIVFDHFSGVDRFLYTIGERIAARRLLEDRRFFNLHGSGVFFRQC